MFQRLEKLDSIFTENEQVFNEFILFNIFTLTQEMAARLKLLLDRRRY